jgi:raffinose synthase
VDVKLGDWPINHRNKGEDEVKWLACARQTRYWMGPSFQTHQNRCIPIETQFLLAEQKQAQSTLYTLILPLVDEKFRSSLQSGKDTLRKNICGKKKDIKKKSIVCHIDSFDEDVHFGSIEEKVIRAVYIIAGSDPFQIIKQGFREVADELKTFETLDRKQLPPIVDEFAWCTWDAFYSDVTPEGVLDGVNSLIKAGVPPKTVIIDDGWQTVTPLKQKVNVTSVRRGKIERMTSSMLSLASKGISAYYDRFVKTNTYKSIPTRIWRRLTTTVLKGELYNYFDSETDFARQLSSFEPNDKFGSFEAHKEVNGLGALVTKLKSLGVNQVMCWHALHGYWRGMYPELVSSLTPKETPLLPEHKDHMPNHAEHLLRLEPVVAWDSVSLFGCGIVTEQDRIDAFYDGLHSTLVRSGVQGVKVSQVSTLEREISLFDNLYSSTLPHSFILDRRPIWAGFRRRWSRRWPTIS